MWYPDFLFAIVVYYLYINTLPIVNIFNNFVIKVWKFEQIILL